MKMSAAERLLPSRQGAKYRQGGFSRESAPRRAAVDQGAGDAVAPASIAGLGGYGLAGAAAQAGQAQAQTVEVKVDHRGGE